MMTTLIFAVFLMATAEVFAKHVAHVGDDVSGANHEHVHRERRHQDVEMTLQEWERNIRGAIDAMKLASNNKDFATLSELYAPDYHNMPPNGGVTYGRAAMMSVYDSMNRTDNWPVTTKMELTMVRWFCKGAAMAEQTYQQRLADGTLRNGKCVDLYVMNEGYRHPQIATSIWNYDRPPVP